MSKKVGDCIVHGLRFPSACSTRRTRHPEIMYEAPLTNYGLDAICLENEGVELPPPLSKKFEFCKPSRHTRRYCHPSPCVCPEKPLIIPLGVRLKNLLWMLTKLGVFAGVVKITDDLRIWSTSEETESLYFAIEAVKSLASSEEDKNPELPGMEQIFHVMSKKWNNGVVYIFSLFGLCPTGSIWQRGVHIEESDSS